MKIIHGPCSTLSHRHRVGALNCEQQPINDQHRLTRVAPPSNLLLGNDGLEEAGVAKDSQEQVIAVPTTTPLFFPPVPPHQCPPRHPSVPKKDETGFLSYVQAKKHVETTVKNMQVRVFLEGRGLSA